jgi:hypothetical protein
VSSVKRWRTCCGSGCCGNPTEDGNASRRVVVVSDAYKLAPWADALVSQDRTWWRVHAEAERFAGRKFSGGRDSPEYVEHVDFGGAINTGTNSGLLACHVAATVYGATRILLLGIDMRGTHYFGEHPAPLKNTTDKRFEAMRRQFAQWKPRGVTVINCAPGSALDCYPKGELDDCLAGASPGR